MPTSQKTCLLLLIFISFLEYSVAFGQMVPEAFTQVLPGDIH
jgi:hypothetical protein